MLSKLFKLPHVEIANVRLFYILSFFYSASFVLPNWVYLFQKYLSISQIGFIDAVAILTGVLLEVPTGGFADVFGKKMTLLVANVCILASTILLIFAHTFTEFLIGNTLMFIGFTFNSGAFEAFLYDTLAEHKKQKDFGAVLSHSTSLGLLMVVGSMMIGGALFTINPIAPFLAWAITSVIAIFVLFCVTEPHIDTHKVTWKSYIQKMKDGVQTIFSHKFRSILVPVIAISILFNLLQGVTRQSTAQYFGFSAEMFSYVFSAAMLLAYFVLKNFDKIHKIFGTSRLFLSVFVSFGLVFILGTSSSHPIVGILYFLLLTSIGRISLQLSSVAANEHIASSHRATALSALSLFGEIPYIYMMFFATQMVALPNIPYFLTGLAVFSGILCVYILWNKKII